VTLTHPSPNFGERRGGQQPELVVLHYTAMQGCAAALERLCDPVAEVSAHYLIDTDGRILSLVDERARAWHAGAGMWAGRGDVNSRSIGIELVNLGNEPFAAAQMTALEGLLTAVLARWALPPAAVIGHSDMAPGRKVDPGPRFDWRRLALRGLSVWPDRAEPGDFAADARRFGYPDVPPEALLAAFRLRFRPWATGPLDATDAALAADLARRFAVDAGAKPA
jgi:N-acetylmuramoyl-L-alanine amidase